jgi:hypothetical protein
MLPRRPYLDRERQKSDTATTQPVDSITGAFEETSGADLGIGIAKPSSCDCCRDAGD